MRLCWKHGNGKQANCVTLPGWPPPFPNQVGGRKLVEKSQEPGVYPHLFIDASQRGIEAGVAALQKRVGEAVSISLE